MGQPNPFLQIYETQPFPRHIKATPYTMPTDNTAPCIGNIVFLRYICPQIHYGMSKYFIYAFAAFAMISCSDYITPDGEIVDCDMEIPAAADGIEITDGMRLVLDEAIPAGTAIIRTHENIQPYIKAETDRDNTIFTVDARRFKNLEVTITTSPASYRTFTASGGAQLYAPDMITIQDGRFIASGGAVMTLSASCNAASIICSGGSELNLKGESATADINCSAAHAAMPMILRQRRQR